MINEGSKRSTIVTKAEFKRFEVDDVGLVLARYAKIIQVRRGRSEGTVSEALADE
jgi:hypothetical protein